jgi:DNA-binding response OmpR family regulator
MSKILVVDDDPAIVDLITETMEAHEVMSATNGSEAIEMARKFKPDMIVMDVTMPKLSGTVACSRIKGEAGLRHIPVILLTGWGKISDIEDGFNAKADDYIVKPFSPRLLKSRIEALMAPGPVSGRAAGDFVGA